MKKNVLLLFVSMFMLLGCSQVKKEKTDIQQEKDAIKLVLEKYAIANETQDMDMIEEIWCPSESIVSFGTLSGEKMVGWAQIRNAVEAQFSRFSNTFISYRDQIIEVNSSGNTAWFSEIINYNFIMDGEAHSYEGLRYSGVLVKKDGKWLLVQTHMSVPERPKKK
ncbi:MAG: nuclear transport factor 2 family protein [Bacteroidales bacterium]|nr:nuclear transport factor 2 family protein [Bacteroidales bacterium]